MHAAARDPDPAANRPPSNSSIEDTFPYIAGGAVLGAVAALAAAMFFGLILAFANHFSGGEICGEGFSPLVVVALAVVGVVVVIAVGRWLFRLRRWIGLKASPEDFAHVKRLRSRFSIASMVVYCSLAPFVWLMAVASANCAGG